MKCLENKVIMYTHGTKARKNETYINIQRPNATYIVIFIPVLIY